MKKTLYLAVLALLVAAVTYFARQPSETTVEDTVFSKLSGDRMTAIEYYNLDRSVHRVITDPNEIDRIIQTLADVTMKADNDMDTPGDKLYSLYIEMDDKRRAGIDFYSRYLTVYTDEDIKDKLRSYRITSELDIANILAQ
ncbi:hypothetical protein ACFFSY_23580 [Paenibacillus aurantiacus]|uniref:Uncharacterized protein n=1 Tax=Paenibacillus aurantiacus TaxID=1936118 RepID=A0ABV5KXY5_9BACL